MEEFQGNEEKALQDEGFCLIFGSPKGSRLGEQKGKIVFFDAFPLSESDLQIEPDIMNPHYAPYYSNPTGNTPPADYHNPNPIYFLTVKDTSFKFVIGIKEKDNKTISTGVFQGKSTLLEIAYKYMEKALSEHGIGAKTAVGYGILKP